MACTLCNSSSHNRRRCPQHPDYDPVSDRISSKRKLANAAKREEKTTGRPLEHKFFEAFDGFPPPPEDQLELCSWAQRILANAMYLTINGTSNERWNAEVRKLAHGIAELAPKERLWQAEQLINRDGNTLRKKPKSQKSGTQAMRRGSKPLR